MHWWNAASSIWHKTYGAKSKLWDYIHNEELALAIRKIPALAFAPPDSIPDLFAQVAQELPPTSQIAELLDYFQSTYIGRTSLGGYYQTATFPIDLWNYHYDTPLGLPRTTNAVDANAVVHLCNAIITICIVYKNIFWFDQVTLQNSCERTLDSTVKTPFFHLGAHRIFCPFFVHQGEKMVLALVTTVSRWCHCWMVNTEFCTLIKHNKLVLRSVWRLYDSNWENDLLCWWTHWILCSLLEYFEYIALIKVLMLVNTY